MSGPDEVAGAVPQDDVHIPAVAGLGEVQVLQVPELGLVIIPVHGPEVASRLGNNSHYSALLDLAVWTAYHHFGPDLALDGLSSNASDPGHVLMSFEVQGLGGLLAHERHGVAGVQEGVDVNLLLCLRICDLHWDRGQTDSGMCTVTE